MARGRAIVDILLWAALAGGCGGEGQISLRFDVPEAPELQPSGAATLTLVARVGGEEPRATTASIGDGSAIDLGDLPIEDEVWLSAELRSNQEQLVGFGQAAGPIAIRAEELLEATIPVRRPFVYVAGSGGRMMSLDASVASSGNYMAMIAAGSPSVIAEVAGAHVAVIAISGAISYLSTSTHEPSDLPGATVPPPLDAVASPDGAFLVVGHSAAVSVVEVASGDVATVAVPAAADRVAITRGSDGAWWGVAVIGAATSDTGCAPAWVAAFPLASPDAAAVVDTGLGIADAAGDVMDGSIVLADRCGDRVLRFDPVTGDLDTATPVMTIPAPTAVAAADGIVWAVGHDRETSTSPDVPDGVVDAWLVLGSAVRGGEADVDALQPVVERVLATEVDYPDQDLTQDLHANAVAAADLVILPGAEHLALLVDVELHGDEYYNGSGDVVIPTLDMETHEYWLVDTASRLPSQRVRTSCTLQVGDCDPFFCLLRQWGCLPDLDPPIAPVGAFTPTAITALFGAQ